MCQARAELLSVCKIGKEKNATVCATRASAQSPGGSPILLQLPNVSASIKMSVSAFGFCSAERLASFSGLLRSESTCKNSASFSSRPEFAGFMVPPGMRSFFSSWAALPSLRHLLFSQFPR